MRAVMDLKKRVGLDSKGAGLYMFTKSESAIRWQMAARSRKEGWGCMNEVSFF